MNRGRINQGIILVLVGLFFLLRNLGWIDDSFLRILVQNWPILLIFAGLYVMLSRSAFWFVPAILSIALFLAFAGFFPGVLPETRPSQTASFTHTVATEAESLEITLDSSAAVFNLRRGSAGTVSGTVAYTGPAPETAGRQIGSQYVVDFRYAQNVRSWSFNSLRAPEWDVRIPSTLPTSVTVHSAYGDLTLDMRGIDARDIDVETPAGSIHILFDHAVTQSNVTIDAAASSVKLSVPRGIGMRLRSSGALISTNLDSLGFTRSGDWYVSPEYDTAERHIEVQFDSAVGNLTVTRDQTA